MRHPNFELDGLGGRLGLAMAQLCGCTEVLVTARFPENPLQAANCPTLKALSHRGEVLENHAQSLGAIKRVEGAAENGVHSGIDAATAALCGRCGEALRGPGAGEAAAATRLERALFGRSGRSPDANAAFFRRSGVELRNPRARHCQGRTTRTGGEAAAAQRARDGAAAAQQSGRGHTSATHGHLPYRRLQPRLGATARRRSPRGLR
mmetsp:Transcript_21302/g.61405  ORF Transcript_21302/g.61405 Transcript_21302/m.61405 type:complete len:207 (+) Transcript_21302:754-1374(+)